MIRYYLSLTQIHHLSQSAGGFHEHYQACHMIPICHSLLEGSVVSSLSHSVDPDDIALTELRIHIKLVKLSIFFVLFLSCRKSVKILIEPSFPVEIQHPSSLIDSLIDEQLLNF